MRLSRPPMRSIFTTLALFACLGPNALAAPTAPTAPAELLEFLIEQNEAARAKIRSTSYTIESESRSDDRRGKREYKSSGAVIARGDYHWSIYRRPNPWLPWLPETTLELESRVVINDKYAACWPDASKPAATWRDHPSIDEMDPDSQSLLKHNYPSYDFFTSCFGHPQGSLRHTVYEHPKTINDKTIKIRYDAVEVKGAKGETLYHIRKFYPSALDDPTKPDLIWTLDPQKGFLVTEMISYHADGNVWINRVQRVEEMADGVWFPMEYEEKRHTFGKQPGDTLKLESWLKVKVKNVIVNASIPDEQFEIDALELKKDCPEIVILRKESGRRASFFEYQGDTLVPAGPDAHFTFRDANAPPPNPEANRLILDAARRGERIVVRVGAKGEAPEVVHRAPLAGGIQKPPEIQQNSPIVSVSTQTPLSDNPGALAPAKNAPTATSDQDANPSRLGWALLAVALGLLLITALAAFWLVKVKGRPSVD